MFDLVGGLPLHPLVVHATEIIVPSATLVVALAALWPAFRRWARFLPLGLVLVALALVPISIQSGEPLQKRVKETPLIETHIAMAEGLLPWVFGLAVVAAVLLCWGWNEREAIRSGRFVSGAVTAAT